MFLTLTQNITHTMTLNKTLTVTLPLSEEMDAKRPTKLPQRESAEENDRADTLSDACQVGDTDGDVPVTQSTPTKSTEAPEATQEAPLINFSDFRV